MLIETIDICSDLCIHTIILDTHHIQQYRHITCIGESKSATVGHLARKSAWPFAGRFVRDLPLGSKRVHLCCCHTRYKQQQHHQWRKFRCKKATAAGSSPLCELFCSRPQRCTLPMSISRCHAISTSNTAHLIERAQMS